MCDNSEHVVEVSTDAPGDLVAGWLNCVDWAISHKVEELHDSVRTRTKSTSETN